MFPIRDHNPSGRRPVVTYALIAANIFVFLNYWSLFDNDMALNRFFWDWALIPARLSVGEGYGGLLTSMFLHGGLLHLAGNMLFLFIFGDNVEDEMGHLGYLAFYLASGLAAAAAQVVAAPLSPVPMVGASGAIAGVMGAYLLMFPKARVDILVILVVIFKVITLPAWILLVLWLALQTFGGIGSPADSGGVAYWAHVGGFAAGIVFALPLWLRRGGPKAWARRHGRPPHPPAPRSLTEIPRIPRRRR
ncbi:rhomboid family intramembrane serine protease [Roseivivax sp. CAU 1761]